MKHAGWLQDVRKSFGVLSIRRSQVKRRRAVAPRRPHFEPLEDRRLLALDYGDAPDTASGTGPGNYNTLSTDNGPNHTIVVGLKLGANVDGDGGALQNVTANADDVNGALPDDEDGLVNPVADLVLTVGAQPRVNVRVTNTIGASATLYGWIDYNADGMFSNATERASIAVPNGGNNVIRTLVFPTVPTGFTGTTYARFRLSTDAAAANPTGPATDGEVEDYRVTVTAPSDLTANSTKTKKIASGTNDGPTLANSDYFGRSVAAVGDIDGDGVTDLAVGANGVDYGGSGRGQVRILLMNANGTVKSSQRLRSSGAGENGQYFGSSVASLGDLDGDGVPDLAVGLERSDVGGVNRGGVWIEFLNANGTEKDRRTLFTFDVGGLADGDYFGRSVSSIGDLDGDGVTDLAVGAYGDDTGGANRGAVHLLFMNANGSVKSRQKVSSGLNGGPTLANSDHFGSSIASLGDLDGDGVTDLAVGAVGDDTGGTGRGAVHILFMNPNGTVKERQKIGSGIGGGPALTNGDQFGRSVAAVGDLDGDGVRDLAVGAYYDDTGGTNRGAIYLLLMNSNGTVKSHQTIASGLGGGPALANDDRFGVSTSSLGDLDGDGVIELAVGANFDDTGGINRGAVYILSLNPVPANTNPVITSPTTANVPENTTAVMTMTATDADVPPQTIAFSIVGGADQARFAITSGGALSFVSPPDFEAPADANGDNVYVVTVQASDGQGGTATQTINVSVTPVNEFAPVFTSPIGAVVNENTTTAMTVTARDDDLPTQAISFSIIGGPDQARFSISSGGVLSFNTPPDYETPLDSDGDNVYEVTVQASDGNGRTATQALMIVVWPVNDNNPVFQSPATAAVPENTTAVMTVAATDADMPLQSVSFSIAGGAEQSKFSITSNGALSFIAPPDFEAPTDSNGDNIYVVTVRANDGQLGTAMQMIEVTVTPLNDNSPVITSPPTASVASGTTSVMTATASDADLPAQSITFSILGGADQSKFAITSGGDLSFITPPNYDLPTDTDGDNIYLVTIQASDNQGHVTAQTIQVTVTSVLDFGDAPDAGPGTSTGNYRTRQSDNGPRHTIVDSLRLGASVDGDGGMLQNAAATADDVQAALPDDEDGVVNPAVDLVITTGVQPTVDVRVTNTTGAAATLYGWIDYNANGVFENATERASVPVPDGTNSGIVTLIFPAVPNSFTGTTYARFRLSTDASASEPIGEAADGEVEDYRVTILRPSDGTADGSRTRKLASGLNGMPALANGDQFGAAVTSLGDLDGDGIPDMAVGSPIEFGRPSGGEVHVLFLNANGSVKSSQKIASGIGGGPTPSNGDYFGHAVASLSDLDGDGVNDLLVGTTKDDTGGYNAGAVYVLFMNPNGTVKGSQKIASGVGDGPTTGTRHRFGSAMADLGDLDGDGVTDVAVGAVGDDFGGTYRGAVHVLLMNPNGTVKASQKIASGLGGGPTLANVDLFGGSLASLGDIDGDGVNDLAVGAPGDDTGGNMRGAVHVLFMNSDGTVKNRQKIASGVSGGPTLADGDSFSRSLARVGDLDGDGINDLAVGAYQDDTGGNGRGAVHVLFLNSDGTVKATRKIADNTSGGPTLRNYDNFGSAIASLGDVDGDGVSDLAVGAERDDTGGNARGAAYVLFLRPGNRSPMITSPITANIAENLTSVMTLTASDPDAPPQTVTFSITGGADQAQFVITGAGVLTFITPPDFEAPADEDGDNVYEVIVEANDGQGGIDVETVNIAVTPVNDNSPMFMSPDAVTVPENSTSVMTVAATDADLPAQMVSFSIVGGADQSKFTITDGGALAFNVPPDFEQPTDANADNTYVVIVQASDGSATQLQAILVTVSNVNELRGDYNENGSVDAADYIVWRKALGAVVSPSTGADGDGDGIVDPDDHGVWIADFGKTESLVAGGTTAATAVFLHSDLQAEVFERGADTSKTEAVGARLPLSAVVQSLTSKERLNHTQHTIAKRATYRPSIRAMSLLDAAIVAWPVRRLSASWEDFAAIVDERKSHPESTDHHLNELDQALASFSGLDSL